MEDHDFDEDDYEIIYEDEDDFEEIQPEVDFDELEDFADDVKEIIEHNQKQVEFSIRELNQVERSSFLENNLIDVNNVVDKVKNVLEKRHNIEERLSNMNPGSAQAWALEDEQRNRELRLKQQMTLAQAGLEGSSLSEIADDASHLKEDAYDSDSRELRKEIKEKFKDLNYSERKQLIEQLLEDGRIDQSQYNYLISEFL